MGFEFATAAEIVFGAGARQTLGARAARLGRRVFVVTGSAGAWAVEHLQDAGLSVETVSLGREPTVDAAREAVDAARRHAADVVVAVGGGSAIDLGKAVSALLTNPGDPLDYVEVIGRGRTITARAAPFIALPTTAGAGAEVTRNAVLAVPAEAVKVSMRSALMLPALALVDPELSRSLPASVTAATGMDALTQLVEPYVSARANPLTDALCLDGMTRVARSLARAVSDGADVDARSDMALAALLGGMALANAGLGAVHGFAAPIGGRFAAPHGAVCAALLPGAMRVNVRALERRAPGSGTWQRFTTVARVLTGNAGASPADAVTWVAALRRTLGIPGLRAYGVTEGDAPALVEAATRASSMRTNPIALEAEELSEILTSAL